MTDTTMTSTGLGMKPIANAIAENRKKTATTADAAEKVQDFSAVFNNIAQPQQSGKNAYTGVESAKQPASQSTKKSVKQRQSSPQIL